MPQPIKSKPAPAPQVIEELRPGQSIELLKELHILTREGKLNQDTRRKLKQVYHLYQFIEPLLADAFTRNPSPSLADHGAGKSYLGFILYDLFFNVAHRGDKTTGHVYGIETRPELVAKSRELAARLGFERMSFLNLSVQEATASSELPLVVDIITALHACDTATDDAIAFGLARQALSLARTPLAELWRHPLHTREFGSQITNVLRCLQLEAHGYDVTVTELVGWEHSMKNELIIASRPDQPRPAAVAAARERLTQVLSELGLGELSARFGVA
jgi:hypothetical protein